ncbi:unnamed protein product, partial [Allacma fusca]
DLVCEWSVQVFAQRTPIEISQKKSCSSDNHTHDRNRLNSLEQLYHCIFTLWRDQQIGHRKRTNPTLTNTKLLTSCRNFVKITKTFQVPEKKPTKGFEN